MSTKRSKSGRFHTTGSWPNMTATRKKQESLVSFIYCEKKFTWVREVKTG
jgi:hypothetical protein